MLTRWRYGRRAAGVAGAIVIALGIVAVGLATVSIQPPPLIHGQRIDIGGNDIRWFDSHDRMLARAGLDEDPTKAVTLLTSAFGLPYHSISSAYGPNLSRSESDWEGLRLTSISDGNTFSTAVSVTTARLGGVRLVADGRYRIGGPFPSSGASGHCTMGVTGTDFTSLVASLTPARVNTVGGRDPGHIVALWESDTRHGVIAEIDAPRLVIPC